MSAALSVCVAGAALLLTGCGASGSAAEDKPEVLSATEGGGIYLEAICPVNDAWGEADVEIDRLRLEVSRGEGDPRRVAAAMGLVADASKNAVVELDPKTLDEANHAWPAEAVDSVEAVQRTLESDRKQAEKFSKFDVKEILAYEWQGAEAVGTAAAEARAALGLPSDGLSACTQWRAQQAEQAAKEQAKLDELATKESPATPPAAPEQGKQKEDTK